MYEPIALAEQVSQWPNLGVKLPEELSKSIEIFEVIRWVEVGHQPRFDLDEITLDNAEAKIHALAQAVALSVGQGPNGAAGSVLSMAKGQVLNAAAARVLACARGAVPYLIEQLSQEFDQAAAAYADAVKQLPARITSDGLLAAGSDVVTAYSQARDATPYLQSVSAWVASTAGVFGVAPETTIRILRPTSGVELVKLDEAARVSANNALAAIDPVLFTAAKLDVEFAVNSMAECAAIRRSLALRPQSLSR